MESSKSDLATAQKNASEQIAIVEADPKKANAIEQKATDVTASLAPLKDAVAAYQTAKQS